MQLRSDMVAHVKPAEAGIAAAYVIRQCVGGGPGQGGVTNNLGRWQLQALALGSGRSPILLIMDIQEAVMISP